MSVSPQVFLRVSLQALFLYAMMGSLVVAQELEPRRWTHLPIGANFAGGAYVYTDASIAFDPVLRLDDVTLNMDSIPLKYIRSIELFDRSARFEVLTAYQQARWAGLVDGAPASTSRQGWSDTTLRLAVNLIGGPPLQGEAFKEYRSQLEQETIVGLGLVVQLPTGQYFEDRLLNLGTNRVTFRPQLGLVHNRGQWGTEVTAVTWFYTDNEDFFNGNLLEQDPFFSIEGHTDYTFQNKLWAGAGLGYGIGGQSTINGAPRNDQRENIGWEFSFGAPLKPQVGIKLAYVGIRTQAPVGADSDSIAVAMSVFW